MSGRELSTTLCLSGEAASLSPRGTQGLAFPSFQSPGSVSQARGGAREWEVAHCPSPPANQSQSHCEPREPQQTRGWPGLVGLGVPSAPHPALEPFILPPGWHLPSCPPLCRGTLFVRNILRLVEGNPGNAQGLALSWFQDFGRTGSIKCTTSDLYPVCFPWIWVSSGPCPVQTCTGRMVLSWSSCLCSHR